jgi:hypothetical protein
MSEVSTNEIPFGPKLPPQHQECLKSFARCVQRLGMHPANSPAWSRKLNQLRTEACEHGQALPLNELKLMVAKNLLLDLATQGWRVSLRGGNIFMTSEPAGNGEIEKEMIRNRHLQERDAQLREPSVLAFVQSMERRRLTPKGWHSIFSVMRDGQELAESLTKLREDASRFEANVDEIIQPYIQFVEAGAHCTETGLLLSDIWRYFRHTWVTVYKSIPGRSLSILIRDRAIPGHPVIGIAALGSAVVQQSIRDKWIGWDVPSVEKALEKNYGARVVKRLVEHLERRINLIYKGDLLGSSFTRWDLKKPSPSLVAELNRTAEQEMKMHRRYPDPAAHKQSSLDEKGWRKKAELHLFRAKRCKELAQLLSIKSVLLQSTGGSLSPAAISKVLEKSAVRHALAQIVRLIKAENVGIHMMDITICGAVAPYNAILGGKLVCALLCSPEVVDYYRRRYGRQVSVIASSMAGRAISKKPHLSLLCTTSLYGNGSSQYNRIKIMLDPEKPPLRYEELGISEGFGSFHFSKECVRLVDILLGRSADGKRVNSIFGEGVNPLMRKMREVLDLFGLSSAAFLKHGNRRIVYGIPLAENFRELLMGIQDRPRYLLDQKDPSAQTGALARYWSGRWLKNRIDNDDVIESVSRHTLSFPMEHGSMVPIERLAATDQATYLES